MKRRLLSSWIAPLAKAHPAINPPVTKSVFKGVGEKALGQTKTKIYAKTMYQIAWQLYQKTLFQTHFKEFLL